MTIGRPVASIAPHHRPRDSAIGFTLFSSTVPNVGANFLNAGVISQDDYNRRVALAAEAHRAMTAGMGESTAGLNRMQQMMSMHVMKALVDETIATGQPLRALALEGGRIAEIFAAGEGGVAGTLNAAKVSLSNLIGPMTATKAALFGIGAGGLVLTAGLAAAIAVFDHLTEKMEEVAKIGVQAQAAGVGTTFFQGWTKQARELNAETSDLVAMLARARAAATESISTADNSEAGNARSSSAGRSRIQQNVLAGNLGQADLDRYTGAADQEARIRVVLDLVEQLRQKGAQLAAFDLAKTFFGDEFEQRLRDGVDVIGRMREALDGMQVAGGERILTQAEIARPTARCATSSRWPISRPRDAPRSRRFTSHRSRSNPAGSPCARRESGRRPSAGRSCLSIRG